MYYDRINQRVSIGVKMKFKKYSLILFAVIIIISNFGIITITNYSEVDNLIFNSSMMIVNEEIEETISTRASAGESSWFDSFDDTSKAYQLENVVIKDGDVSLPINDTAHYTYGSITSTPIVAEAPCDWYKFGASHTKFEYQRVITIDNTMNSRSFKNYPIKITVDTYSLILNGKMRADCGDIRFFAQNGTNLNYWLESGINTTSTKIFVKIPSISSYSKIFIYMNYGYPIWWSRSDGKATFEYFDSFFGPGSYGYDESYWERGGTASFGVYSRSIDPAFDKPPASLQCAITVANDDANLHKYYSNSIHNKMVTIHFYDNHSDAGQISDLMVGKHGDFMRFQTDNSQLDYYYLDYYSGANQTKKNLGARTTGWHEVSAAFTETSVSLYYDGSLVHTRSVTDYNRIWIGYAANWSQAITHWYDAFYVRPYYQNEPLVTISPEPASDVEIVFKILNADDDSEIMTVESQDDLLYLTNITATAIKLKAEFYSHGGGSPILRLWQVNWNTKPIFGEVAISNRSINRTHTSEFSIEVHDVEDSNDYLSLIISYQVPDETEWKTNNLSEINYLDGRFKCTFSTTEKTILGSYYFKIHCEDSRNSMNDYFITIDVLNNKPLTPEVLISPMKPKTTDNLTTIISDIGDIETDFEDLEVWYYWYKNRNIVGDYENASTVPSAVTSKDEIWRCEVVIFDGNDVSEPTFAEVKIINSGPELIEAFSSYTLNEDSISVIENKLSNIFADPDNDELTFSAIGQNHLKIDIFQNNGSIRITPQSDWSGIESVVFSANDSESTNNTDNVDINVLPVNDPPSVEITNPPSKTTIEKDDNFIFSCDAEDIDLSDPNVDEKLSYCWYAETPDIVDLGNGSELINPQLPTGAITVWVEVTDSAGVKAYDSVEINVVEDEKDNLDEDNPVSDVVKITGDSSSILWFFLIIIIIAIVIVILLIRKRKKRSGVTIQPDIEQHSGDTLKYTDKHIVESSPEALSSQYLDVQVQPTSQQQIPLDQTAPPSYSSLTEATQISDNGLTLEEKIKLLDSRLLKGEIDQNSYDYLRAELEEH